MLRRAGLRDFVEREIFYIAVMLFDLLAFGMILMGRMGAASPEPNEAAFCQVPDLERLLNPDYLHWAKGISPVLVSALVLLKALVFVAGLVGVGLLLWAAARVRRRQPILRQQPIIEAQWTLWDVAKIACIYLFLMFLGFSVVSRIIPLHGISEDKALLVSLGVNYFALAGTLLFICRVVCVERGQPLRALGWALPGGPSDLRRTAGCYAALQPLFFAALFITQALAARFGIKLQPQEIVPRFMSEQSLSVMVTIMVLACVVAPILEETFFRGFLQPALRNRLGQRAAILLTALVFAGAHRSLSVFLPVLVLGLMLGYLYEKTQSTFASAMLHAMHNTVTTCFLLIVKYLPVHAVHYQIV